MYTFIVWYFGIVSSESVQTTVHCCDSPKIAHVNKPACSALVIVVVIFLHRTSLLVFFRCYQHPCHDFLHVHVGVLEKHQCC